MKHQRGDAGIGMLAVMAVLMLGHWLLSGHMAGRGGAGHHHRMGGHGEASAEPSVPVKTGAEEAQTIGDPSTGH